MENIVKNETMKNFLHSLADSLPDTANLDDVMYELYVKKKVDIGREQLKNRKEITLEELKKKYNR